MIMTAGTAAGCGGNQEPQRERDIPAQMGRVEHEIDKLNGACQALCDRISAVTRGTPVIGMGPPCGKEQDLYCELARWMRDQAVKIKEIRELVEIQLELLEI